MTTKRKVNWVEIKTSAGSMNVRSFPAYCQAEEHDDTNAECICSQSYEGNEQEPILEYDPETNWVR